MYRLILATLVCASINSFIGAEEPTAAGIQFFESKIRPVLVQHCYECHSNEAQLNDNLESELLLDSQAGIRKGGESGPAIVPGEIESSLLIKAIRHDSFNMPPDTKLAPEIIADFTKWVEMGAPDPRDEEATELAKKEVDIDAGRRFWSFQPLQHLKPSAAVKSPWIRTDIDRYIYASLKENKLEPNLEANRRTLIRRAYFDLWGLPPEPAEVDDFVNDPSPDAYEKLVDRLLAGQHYGERWARHWLDLARFAESNGYAFDKDRAAAFHYRDFVIKSLNQDMPYDQFVRLQIAGDQIAPNDFQSQAATGFLAAGTFTSQQTQKERERSRYEQLDDVVGTIGTSMLGLTIGCARCHDHKFDPLPTQDYYRFTACFAETGFQDFDYDPDPAGTKAAKDKFDTAHKPFTDARVKFEKSELTVRLNQWLILESDPPPSEKLGVWQTIGPFAAADFKKAYNEAFAPEKKVDLKATYDQLKWTPQPDWADGEIHNKLSGDNSANYLYRTIEVAQKGPLEISLGRDDAIKVFLNGKQVLAKEVMGGVAADQDKVTLQLNAGSNDLLIKIVNAGGASGFYFSTKMVIPKNIQAIIDIAEDKRNAKQKQALLKWYAPRDADWIPLNKAEQEHLKKKPVPKITKVYASRKNGVTYNFGDDTRKVYFLARGNSNAKKGLATPGFFRVLTASAHNEKDWLTTSDSETENPSSLPPRVALADWLTDDQQGAGNLLARVIVNRLWQHHMGRGIVGTPSDFGSQGAPPTHPELLDYLATELIRNDWKLKPIHQLIMKSAVYRQSGENNKLATETDLDNKLWWRRGATRLEAEVIRDTLLSVSGSLDKTMFGKGSLDQTNPRRSIYLTVKRSNLIPILQLFDAPDAIQSIGHRDVTTVPPQALALMNSPLARQLSEKFAKRIYASPETTTEQVVNQAYDLALSRVPTETEKKQMIEFIAGQAASYGNSDKAMNQAVVDYCQIMLCLNEFLFID
ncbi:MAG: PSD1 and planctomycete cytochrome C domain-containing protein [Pirellulales bacterium]